MNPNLVRSVGFVFIESTELTGGGGGDVGVLLLLLVVVVFAGPGGHSVLLGVYVGDGGDVGGGVCARIIPLNFEHK